MRTYTVDWSINVEADSHEAAARKAFDIMRLPNSRARFFAVYDDDTDESKTVDIDELDQQRPGVTAAPDQSTALEFSDRAEKDV